MQLMNSARKIQSLLKRLRKKRKALEYSPPFRGYSENRCSIQFVDSLSDNDLEKLNQILAWKCFVADKHGRRFGNAAWNGKRILPQIIPDTRIVKMHEHFDLSNKHVLEIGCFEGIHTVALSGFASRVTAIDSRIENVVKTIVRTSLFGFQPTVWHCNVENVTSFEELRCDVLHHVGVLYHLQNPVQHILDFGRYVGTGIMLDTHYAMEEEADSIYKVGGRTFSYKRYGEGGRADVFSGMYDHAKWLSLDTIVLLLKESGFSSVEIIEKRAERNGPRARLFAQRG